MAAEDIIKLLEKATPPHDRLKPGQTVTIVDASLPDYVSGEKHADRKVIPVVLSVNTTDKRAIMNSDLPRKEKIAIIAYSLGEEAKEQGGILSIAQTANLLYCKEGYVSLALREYSEKFMMELPFHGYLEDQGATVTHKEEIIDLEGVGFTPPEISELTKHSPESRDRYLNMFHRIKAFARVLKQVPKVKQIQMMMGCRKSVARHYLKLFKKHVKRLAEQNPAFAELANEVVCEVSS
jgi:hypothetical protein